MRMDKTKRYDGMLFKIAQKHVGGISELLDTFFGFLYRKTDFFHGTLAGIPTKKVLDVLTRYEKLAEEKRNVNSVTTGLLNEEEKKVNDVGLEPLQTVKSTSDEDQEINEVEYVVNAVETDTTVLEEGDVSMIGSSENVLDDPVESKELNESTSSITSGNNSEVVSTDTPCSVLTNQKENKRKLKVPSKNITPIPAKKKTGRPKLEFDTYRAKHLISLGFTMAQVCNTLGISDGTLRRFRDGNKDCTLYDKITDEELDMIIMEVKKEHVHIGEKRLLGLLKGRGIRIQRKRLRDSIHRVDPCGPKKRCNAGIALVNSRTSLPENELNKKPNRLKKLETKIQVPFNVSGPNNVWRIDTITRLERWKINITFGIDLFSRVIVFIVASSYGTHLAETNKSSFKKAVNKYSWPDSIVSDNKEEKSLIWKEVQETKGYNSAEVNDKLERIQWITIIKNDLNLNIFRSLSETFYSFELEGSFNLSNDVDLFCLHFVYLPRMNKLLDDFVTSYNASPIPHGIGATPLQIFYAHSKDGFENTNVLSNISNSKEPSTIEITLHESCPIPDEKLEDLYDYVRPLEESADNGKELYYRTGTYVTEYLQSIVEVEDEVCNGQDDKADGSVQFNSEEDMFSFDQFSIGQKNVNPNIILNKSNCPLTTIVSQALSFEEPSSSSENNQVDMHTINRNSDIQIVGNINLSVGETNLGIYEFYDDSCHT